MGVASESIINKWGTISTNEYYRAENVREEDGFETYYRFKKIYGKASKGREWHHIVEQSQIKKSGINPKLIHSPRNIIEIDKNVHRRISAHYKTRMHIPKGEVPVRDWLAGQSFEVQYEYGINILKEYGVIK